MVNFNSKNNRFFFTSQMRSVIILSEENYYRLNTLKTFSPLGEKIEFCFQYSFSQNTSIIWKCKLAWDRQRTSWTQGFVSFKSEREEIWKAQNEITSSEFTFDFHRFNCSAASGSTDSIPSCIIQGCYSRRSACNVCSSESWTN